ncbi:MAG: hydantoinase/oxoprolinase family protein [Spirochaetaceae bacterium]|nr:hydantoinase/oxoprolinase family protein [Spirochaetaceae bacterium]
MSSALLDKNITFTTGSSDNGAPVDSRIKPGPSRRIGLGIDAGGTYTDAVIYDFQEDRVMAKAKALTTKWKYSEGIIKAVDSLPDEYMCLIDLISISTTLVTNAVVESNRRPVGLLLMPTGREAAQNLKHQPMSVIRGRMTIGGDVTEDVDPDEIRSIVRNMISHFHTGAFAVSGYGGSVNPELELRVKYIVRDETGMKVCCGHELSGILNFSVRAATAVLNAGVMPIMEDFLKEMELSIAGIGIRAPILVVRGDGAVMSEGYAREYPVQAALSGPAASMAGAIFLTGMSDAVVIDIGGTTSDIGFLENGRVAVCDAGARIGDWDTHVKAVDMLTSGLGGDSEILFEKQKWILGPRRITPICWLAAFQGAGGELHNSLDDAGKYLNDWTESTEPLQFLYRTGKEPDFKLTSREQAVFNALASNPLMIWQVKESIGAGTWRLVKSGRLENSYCVQRAGLTPTDLYHREGHLSLWDNDFAKSYMRLIADSSGVSSDDLGKRIRLMISNKLGTCLLRKMLGSGISEGTGTECILNHGNPMIELKPGIRIPVIGLGAPAALMMRDVMKRLGGELTLNENGDVANAVGAITSKVTISRHASVAATSAGGFRIHGLDGENRHYESLEEAEEQCIGALVALTRTHGRKAGTSASDVMVTIKSVVARTAEGSELFIERLYDTLITGVPDLV